MRYLLPLALALALPACATTGTVTQQTATAISRADAAWSLIKATAALWMPRLSVEHQALITVWIARGDQALAAARIAQSAAELTAALTQVNAAAAQVTAVATPEP